ncbi:MAG: 6-bladed beta-propeller [Rikenellaceae bacterium]
MKNLPILILLLALISCQETVTQVATVVDGVITVNTSDVKDTIGMKLSDLIENIEIVLLDSKIEAYAPANNPVTISENYIIIPDNDNVKLFDRKTGKFITNITSKGNGPGEFRFFMEYNYINEEKNVVYMVDYIAARNILEFDLQGNFKRQIPLADKRSVNYTKFIIDEENEIITVFSVPYNSIVWQQDFEGNFLTDRAVILHDRATKNFPNSSIVNNTFNIYISKYYNKQDTLYKYDKENHKINPVFTVKVNEYAETNVYEDSKFGVSYLETTDRFIASLRDMKIEKYKESSYNMNITYVKHLIVNKDDLTGCYANLKNNFLFNRKIDLLKNSNGYFYESYAPEKLMEIIENATDEDRKNTDPKILKQIDELYKKLDEESNTTIFLGKLK